MVFDAASRTFAIYVHHVSLYSNVQICVFLKQTKGLFDEYPPREDFSFA